MFNLKKNPRVMKKLALLGTYSPRKCGIASFTYDLFHHICKDRNNCSVIAMNDDAAYNYPTEVKFQINQHSLDDYIRVSEEINQSDIEVVCIQHEFGIYGGENGKYLLEFMKRLNVPMVTTLHTVLDNPSDSQKEIIQEIGKRSSQLIVMSEMGKNMLEIIYRLESYKIQVIEHGIPDPDQFPFKDYKEEFGIEGKKVLLTFGLLSQSKGIETTLKALPEIIKKHSNVVYVVLGASHPHVIKHEGESYRQKLMELSRQLQISSHVIFVDRFVTQEELFGFLQMSDIYIIPYLSEKQITSGTLAYAMATDNAVVSTPFWHAQEALAEDKGIFFGFNDSNSLGKIVTRLLDNQSLLVHYQKRAANYARQFLWRNIGEKYLKLFQSIRQPTMI
jgi:glycosyltransferase involved in cell wall biosynthesis